MSPVIVIGCRVSIVEVGGRIFHGTVYLMDKTRGILILKDVECVTINGLKFNLMTFQSQDILDLDVLEPPKQKKSYPVGAKRLATKVTQAEVKQAEIKDEVTSIFNAGGNNPALPDQHVTSGSTPVLPKQDVALGNTPMLPEQSVATGNTLALPEHHVASDNILVHSKEDIITRNTSVFPEESIVAGTTPVLPSEEKPASGTSRVDDVSVAKEDRPLKLDEVRSVEVEQVHQLEGVCSPVVPCSSIETKTRIVTLDTLDHQYLTAIENIFTTSIIGVAMEGIDLSRDGQLCWVQVYVEGTVYLFDILKLGEKAFNRGLRKILQSQTIQKVIHDCRGISDLLYHQYRTQLVNVFDTQVADLIVHMEGTVSKAPRHVTSLIVCLTNYITGLPVEHIFNYKLRETQMLDGCVWKERPMTASCRDTAVLNVVHLKALRVRLMQEMLSVFTDGCDVYLGLMRDASNHQVQHMKHHSALVPVEFQSLQWHARRVRNRQREAEEKSNLEIIGATEESLFAITPMIDESAPPGSTLIVNPRNRGKAVESSPDPSTPRERIKSADVNVDWDVPGPPEDVPSRSHVDNPLADLPVIPGGHENAFLRVLDKEFSVMNRAQKKKKSTEFVYPTKNRNVPDVIVDSRLSGGESSTSQDDEGVKRAPGLLTAGRPLAAKPLSAPVVLEPPLAPVSAYVPLCVSGGGGDGSSQHAEYKVSSGSHFSPGSGNASMPLSPHFPTSHLPNPIVVATPGAEVPLSDLSSSALPCSMPSGSCRMHSPDSGSGQEVSSPGRPGQTRSRPCAGRGQAMLLLLEQNGLNK